MSDRVQAPGGHPPSADVVRLLRLLSRRGALLDACDGGDSGDGASLRVMRGGDCLGLVARPVLAAAISAALVEHRSEGWRISAAGRVLLADSLARASRPGAAGGAPGAAGVPPATACAADDERRPEAPSRPGFDADESPLTWLARRRDRQGQPLIEPIALAAGERLRADFWFAHMTPRITANWSPDAACGRGGGGSAHAAVEMRDAVVAAQERVRRALAAVGPELAGILVDVCGHLKGLEQAERGAGWPARSGKIILQLALSSLARHYGLKPEPRDHGPARVRHWGGEGYRPSISEPSGE